MHNAQRVFHVNMKQAEELGGLFKNLSELGVGQFDDLLRSQIVQALSAFDKLMHDLIRIGMVEIFEGRRQETEKYLKESIAIRHFPNLMNNSAIPAVITFDRVIQEKLSIISYQAPDKIADGLSYIWGESQKWQKIASGLNMTDRLARQRQTLIVSRRNAIVHEADLDPVSGEKQAISRQEANDISHFLFCLGEQIYSLVH